MAKSIFYPTIIFTNPFYFISIIIISVLLIAFSVLFVCLFYYICFICTYVPKNLIIFFALVLFTDINYYYLLVFYNNYIKQFLKITLFHVTVNYSNVEIKSIKLFLKVRQMAVCILFTRMSNHWWRCSQHKLCKDIDLAINKITRWRSIIRRTGK